MPGSTARMPTTAQDLFQEIVLQLWRAWPRYVPAARCQAQHLALPHCAERGHLQPAPAHPPPRPGALDAEALARGPSARSRCLRCPKTRAALYRAIGRLSDVDKAFVLLYLEDRPYEEMADILGITQNNVRVKMHRVQEKLRRLLVSAQSRILHGTQMTCASQWQQPEQPCRPM
ncbi:MAG: sigma-70 family RNA polymerase sigma factor [Hymenobacter sp.]